MGALAATAAIGIGPRYVISVTENEAKTKLDAMKIASHHILTLRPGCAKLPSRSFKNCLYLLVGGIAIRNINVMNPLNPHLTDLS